ncbi:HAD family hydrolase [Mycobacteroides abscessus]|uniref:HAD family hydrolase n=1 Tax=Mycobacteroides abscessus TaxID=36809 RepID=UPI002102B2BD|nr:HAD family phosphatase [Mycobacteroides abscessus]
MTELPTHVSGIVFDCDGLLLDTETCWSRAESALFAKYGFPFGPVEKNLLIGRTLEEACANMAEYFGMIGEGSRLRSEFVPLVEYELSRDVTPMPGAEEMLSSLAGRGVSLGVATNSPRQMLDNALESANLSHYFEVTIAADEVARPKPAPELYLTAFDRLGVDPTTGIALEDSATGVAAARAAGCFLITVPSQPGKQLDGDYVTASLADPQVQHWARTVQVRRSDGV